MSHVKIQLSGGFGNNLQQYLVGCLMADALNLPSCILSHNHPVTHPDSMTSIYLVAKKLKGDVPNTLIFNETRTVIQDSFFPFNRENFYEHRNFIKKHYLSVIDDFVLPFAIQPEDIVVSVRLGMNNEVVVPSPYSKEPSQGGYRMPFDEYVKILDTHTHGKIIVCCDSFENIAFLNQFTERYHARVIFANYNTLLQFKVMLMAKTLVCPDSSYSSMCALLSDATTVYKYNASSNKTTTYIQM